MSEFSIKQYQNEVEKIIHFGGTKERDCNPQCLLQFTEKSLYGKRGNDENN